MGRKNQRNRSPYENLRNVTDKSTLLSRLLEHVRVKISEMVASDSLAPREIMSWIVTILGFVSPGSYWTAFHSIVGLILASASLHNKHWRAWYSLDLLWNRMNLGQTLKDTMETWDADGRTDIRDDLQNHLDAALGRLAPISESDRPPAQARPKYYSLATTPKEYIDFLTGFRYALGDAIYFDPSASFIPEEVTRIEQGGMERIAPMLLTALNTLERENPLALWNHCEPDMDIEEVRNNPFVHCKRLIAALLISVDHGITDDASGLLDSLVNTNALRRWVRKRGNEFGQWVNGFFEDKEEETPQNTEEKPVVVPITRWDTLCRFGIGIFIGLIPVLALLTIVVIGLSFAFALHNVMIGASPIVPILFGLGVILAFAVFLSAPSLYLGSN